MKKTVLCIMLLSIIFVCNSQNYKVERFSFGLSLRSDFIHSILVDGDNIWVGTHKGLSLINSGKIVSNYFANYKTVSSGKLVEVIGNSFLIDNRINDIEKISDKYYLATEGGLNIFDYISSNWSTIHKDNSRLQSNAIKCLASVDTVLWIGTQDKGLYTYDTVTGESRKEGKDNSGNIVMDSERISSLQYVPSADMLIVGTYDRGIFIYSDNEWKNITTKYPLKSRLPSDRINCTEYGDREIWVGTPKGLVGITQYNHRLLNEKQGFEYPVILSLLYFREKLFIGTGRGLYVMDEAGELSRFELEDKYRILDIKAKDDNTLFLATQNSGVFEIVIP